MAYVPKPKVQQCSNLRKAKATAFIKVVIRGGYPKGKLSKYNNLPKKSLYAPCRVRT